MDKKETKKNSNRLYTLDLIRSLAVLGMILIHLNFDFLMILSYVPEYTRTTGYEVFCQLVRITFIFLSGYCSLLGKKTLKRGLIVSGAGLAITLGTAIFRVDPPIVFGVLTLIGACMLISILFKKIITEKNAFVFFPLFLVLFLFFLHIHDGYCGFVWHRFFLYPRELYSVTNPVLTYILAFLGLPGRYFASSDYFPLVPWFFLFMSGFSFYRLFGEKLKDKKFMKINIVPLTFIGRYSLIIYLAHQPLLLGAVYLVYLIMNR